LKHETINNKISLLLHKYEWELVADSPCYPTFVFEKLKMIVLISESGQLENESGNCPNPFLQIQM
jgi:hypothetical protein